MPGKASEGTQQVSDLQTRSRFVSQKRLHLLTHMVETPQNMAGCRSDGRGGIPVLAVPGTPEDVQGRPWGPG